MPNECDRVYHNSRVCHATHEKREDALKKIRCWIRTIERGDECERTREANRVHRRKSCTKNILCDDVYREIALKPGPLKPASPFICSIPTVEVRPTSDVPEMRNKSNPRVIQAFYPTMIEEIPAWKRPRVNSQRLIGGNWWSMRNCYKHDGINDDKPYCPRDSQGGRFKTFKEAIEYQIMKTDNMADQMKTGYDKYKNIQTCCSPRDPPPPMPGYTCHSCGVCEKNLQWAESGCGAPYFPPDEIAMYEGRPRKEGCD